MKRLRAILWGVLTALSLLVGMAAQLLAVRSYWVADIVSDSSDAGSDAYSMTEHNTGLEVGRGVLLIINVRARLPDVYLKRHLVDREYERRSFGHLHARAYPIVTPSAQVGVDGKQWSFAGITYCWSPRRAPAPGEDLQEIETTGWTLGMSLWTVMVVFAVPPATWLWLRLRRQSGTGS